MIILLYVISGQTKELRMHLYILVSAFVFKVNDQSVQKRLKLNKANVFSL